MGDLFAVCRVYVL